MKTIKLIKKPVIIMPDGSRILSFHLVNGAGHRVGKISGDLNIETENQIKSKYVAR